MNDTAGRERWAAARIDWQSMSAIDLLDAYMVALGTAIRRPASMIERSDEIRMELLRRLNAKDAASAARQLIRQVVNAHWGEQGGAVADAILAGLDHAGLTITPTDEASGEEG